MPETTNQANYSTCSKHHLNGYGEPFPEGKSDALDCTVNCSQLSTSTIMSQKFTPTFVYQRRRQKKNTFPFVTTHSRDDTKPSNGCHSAISSDAVRSLMTSPVECHKVAPVSSNGCPGGKEVGSEEALVTNVDSINENCSSSKSNLAISSTSLKIDMDERGECSSSGAMIADKASEEMSEQEICISILKSQGILDKVWTRRNRATTKNTGVRRVKYCSKSCNVCRRLDSTSNMLICDGCEDAFHISCCNRNIIPVGEWLCSSCLKKKHKLLKEKSACNSVNISQEPEGELGSLGFMLSEIEPHMSNVRIGDEFQANVPKWCGPIDDASNLTGEPLEIDPSNGSNMQERDSTKPLNNNSVGNWLQCREVIEGAKEGVDEIVCGKWRRAPIFEVQTDEFECFHCILWDPAHADCAVPQELDTEEVMKQLKYIEMLRPRLAAKRRKLGRSKSSRSQEQSKSRD